MILRGASADAPFELLFDDFEEPREGEALGESLLADDDGLEFPADGGAAVARDMTLLHCAAALAVVSLGLNGKYDTSPWLSS